MQIAILGAGSWGSALAIAFSQIARVTLYSRNNKQVALLQESRRNPGYLPKEIVFPESIMVTNKLAPALVADLIIIATPLNAVRGIFEQITANCGDSIPDVVLVSKGFEAQTGKLPHEIVADVLPGFLNYGLLLGPSFAREVALQMPTAITLSAPQLDFARKWMQLLQGIPNFRIYAHDDVVGSEVGAAVKNVLGIASGISDGLQFGYNARAALITRGLHELGALVIALGGKAATIYGLTGIGDLILTCTGDLSRNRQVGLELAHGKPIAQIVNDLGHVAEGVLTAKEVYAKAYALGIEMPIIGAVYRIIYENSDIRSEVSRLITREPKTEFLM